MRIAIDYTAAAQRAGIGRYARELVRALLRANKDYEIRLVLARDQPADVGAPASRLPLTSRQATILWQRLGVPLPVEWLIGGADLFHATDYLLPPLRQARGVCQIHDLSFLIVPETGDPRLVRYLREALPRSLARATLVLADSACTREDLLRCYGLDPERVVVVPAGVSPHFQPVTDPRVLAAARARYGLPEAFLLFVGTLEPRKNLVRLVEAYGWLRGEAACTLPLVLAGGRGWRNDALLARIRELDLEESVVLPGFVAEEDLPALLSAASLFVYPSLYEGFGLPPLEAMACGAPVVASNAGSLPEVLGEAALLPDPRDARGIGEAMARLLSDAALRARLREAGLRRAAGFTWAGAAQRLLAAYDVAAGLPRRQAALSSP